VLDPWEKNVPGLGLGRDPERTPMQWDGGPTAGFTSGRPWLPVAPDSDRVNVASQRHDSRSILTLHRRLLALRRERPALAVGVYEPVEAAGNVLAYARGAGAGRCLVALNLGSSEQQLEVPTTFRGGRALLCTGLDRDQQPVGNRLDLRPDEGVVLGR
jgi:alpha-glucosidase